MKTKDMFPSKYIQAAIDLLKGGRPIEASLTIEDVTVETFKRDSGADETKYVLRFQETEKSLILNKTNYNILLGLYPADDTDEWIGEKITLTAKQVEFKGQTTWGTRISLLAPEIEGEIDDPFEGAPEPPDDFPF